MQTKLCLGTTLCLATLVLHTPAALAEKARPAPAPAATPEPEEPRGSDFYVVNATQLPITGLNASRVEEDNWGLNRLGTVTLAPGARFLVRLPNDGTCRYDIRASFQGGTVREERNLDACKLASFRVTSIGTTPTPAAGMATTPPPAAAPLRVTFANNFHRPLKELRISPTSSTSWGDDRLPSGPVAPHGQVELTLPAGQGCHYDLRATFEGASAQEIKDANLCTAETVGFDGPRPGSIYAYGTGFRVSAQGHILTNNHVVQGCGSVAILAKDRRLPLTLVGQDAVVDLAMLQQPDTVSPFLSFRDLLTPVRPAERAISIGYPIPNDLGDRVVTEGIVNALTGMRGNTNTYQLQTPIQPGNSGGPIFDRNGLVIGVAVSGLDKSGERIIQNVNFAISPVMVGRFAQSLGVQLHYEPGTQELTTADIMDRNADRVVQLVCLN